MEREDVLSMDGMKRNSTAQSALMLRRMILMLTVVVTVLTAAALLQAFVAPYAYALDDGLADDYSGKIVVLQSNDVHGKISGYQYIAGLRNELEKRGADVILADCGDFSQGLPAVSYRRGETAIRMMNKAGYDVVSLGNHEFDYGYDRLRELLESAEFEVLCNDIVNKDGNFVLPRSKVIEKDGVKIGFTGTLTPETQTKAGPMKMSDLRFLDADSDPSIFSQMAEDVRALRESGADLVICLTHLGVDVVSSPYRSVDFTDYLKTKEAIYRPDMILDAHSHTVMTEDHDKVPIMSTGTEFRYIGVMTVDKKSMKLDTDIPPMLYEVKEGSSYSDPDVKAESDSILNEVEEIYGEVIGRADVVLNGNSVCGALERAGIAHGALSG